MRYLVFIFLLAFGNLSLTQVPLKITDSTDNGWQYLEDHSSYYYSENDTLTIDGILANPDAIEFKKLIGDEVNDKHYTEEWCWLKLEINNKSNFSSDWLVYYGAKHLKLYEIKNDKTYRIHETGSGLNSKDREIIHGNVNFVKIILSPNSISTYYIQLKGFYGVIGKLIKAKPIEDKFKKSNYWMGIFMGVMLIILITNFILYWSSKDKTYLIYSAYVLFFTLMCLCFKGSLFELFFPNTTWINNFEFIITLASTTLIIYAVFTNSFLQLKEKNILWHKIIRISIYTSLVLYLFMAFLMYSGFFYITTLIILFWTLALFILCNIPAIIQWRKKFQPAGMFVLGNLILIGGQFLFLLAKTGGGTEDNTFTIYYYLEFSLICQVIIFSKGIGDRINIMRKESEQAQEKAMLQLETKVKERTQQLNEQKLLVEEQNQEIKDSITYAKRIQEAILPNSNAVKETFPDSFVLYQPKDIVAGDFYWMERSDELINFAVADCTGHGVPGAMVSIVCHNALNRSVREYNCTEPAAILDNTRKLVIDSLSKNKMDVKDGMDISLISYDPKKMNILFAGANNGLYLIRNNELTNYKSDRQPIGVFEDQKPFNQQKIDLQKGDIIYLYTDGFADQFGGEKGKKLKTSNFKKLLIEIHQLPMNEQKEKLHQSFENWRNEIEQIDDLCIAGIRF